MNSTFLFLSIKVVSLAFERFELEEAEGSTCDFDYLSIEDGWGTELGRWCGAERPAGQLDVPGPVTLTFHSDGSVQGRGFEVEYSLGSLPPEGSVGNSPPEGSVGNPSGDGGETDEEIGTDNWIGIDKGKHKELSG